MTDETPTVSEAMSDLTTAIGDSLSGLFGRASDGGSGARAAVERAVDQVADDAEGFATSVAAALSDVDAAGIDEVKPTDDGWEIHVDDAHGEQAARSLAEMDPRSYEVTLRTDGDVRVVELVESAAEDAEATAEDAAREAGDATAEAGDEDAEAAEDVREAADALGDGPSEE